MEQHVPVNALQLPSRDGICYEYMRDVYRLPSISYALSHELPGVEGFGARRYLAEVVRTDANRHQDLAISDNTCIHRHKLGYWASDQVHGTEAARGCRNEQRGDAAARKESPSSQGVPAMQNTPPRLQRVPALQAMRRRGPRRPLHAAAVNGLAGHVSGESAESRRRR